MELVAGERENGSFRGGWRSSQILLDEFPSVPPRRNPFRLTGAHLEDVAGTLAAEVVLAGQDDHRLGEHLQADWADELLLQVLHGESAAC